MTLRRRMRSIPLADIRLTDAFWTQWQQTLREVTIEAEYQKLAETPRLANFRRAAGDEEGTFDGRYYDDSDVYKWAEACAYALALGPHSQMQKRLDEIIGLVGKAQEPSG